MNTKFFHCIIFFSFLLLVNLCSAKQNIEESFSARDSFDIKDASFLLPQAQPSGKYSSAITLLNVVLPRDWTFDVIKAPMFCYSGKYTLPANFNLQGTIATLIVSTRVYAGPFWNLSVNDFHLGIGYQFAYNYGVLKQFGFHTTLKGWEQQPTIILGYSFPKMALTLRGDLYWTNSLYLSEGKNVIPFKEDFVNGTSININLEQRITKNRVMSIGFKLSYLRYHILAWPAFPVNRTHYNIPELQFGLNF
jgi:hypothetical protein